MKQISREEAFLLWLQGRIGEKLNRFEMCVNHKYDTDRCRKEIDEARKELMQAFSDYYGDADWKDLVLKNFDSGWKLENHNNWILKKDN